MSLKFGRTQLAIPGPSVIPERVLGAMHRPSPNIYAGELVEMTESIVPDLKAVARTKHQATIYISNGHGVWEAALRNTLISGDKVLVLGTGRFAEGWASMAKSIGIEVELVNFGMQSCADPDVLEETLRKDSKGDIRAVMMVQTDTASSVINDVAACRQAIDRANHNALFMVDCIASLACDRFEMDEWGVDVTVSACQKGLMTPAGLGFIYFNDKAAGAKKRTSPGEYWDWDLRAEPEIFYQRFDGTAPTHHLYGLRAALDILVHEEGIENVWTRHKTIAHSVWSAIDAWGKSGSISHNIQDRAIRSHAVSTVNMSDGNAARLRSWTEENAGLTLGIGLGFPEADFGNHFRIGHMGHQNLPMVMGVLGTIDAALKALDIPHGDGALDAASKVLAAHPAA